MDFVHDLSIYDETIAAICTPPGEGGVAIIRISGKDAIAIADKIFNGPVSKYKSHTVHFGKILNKNKDIVDEVLLLVMRTPRSYTGDDTVEIHCHGGSLISRRVLDVVIQAGARPAKPGEFTQKAYLNGKIDLTQAEAVQELIAAKSEHALNSANMHLQGTLSEKIRSFQISLTEIAAILEAWVDFPEEGLEFTSLQDLLDQLNKVNRNMLLLAETFRDGKIIKEGISLCLIGRPNVGKSSLMNALLKKERAIVSEIPGTTRDILEADLCLNGLNFHLIDTAGIHDSTEIIEKEGIKRSEKALQESDLILLVLDANTGLTHEDHFLINKAPKDRTLVIWNKIDLPFKSLPTLSVSQTVSVSAKKEQGFEALKSKIDALIWDNGPPSQEEVWITNLRHQESLLKAIESCEKLIVGLQSNTSPEFLALEIRACLHSLGKIIGTNISEDILSAIFSKFCIGK